MDERGDERRDARVAGPRLDRQRTLPDRREHLGESESERGRLGPPETARPAAAKIVPAMPCSSSLRRRVCTLPRMSTRSRSGRSASSCERRLRLDVPTVAPLGRSSSVRSGSDPRPTNTSRTSSRAVKATMARPSGTSVGMSFAECTARSVRPSSMAVSSSLVNRPLSPSLASGASSSLSPLVWMTSISTCSPGCSRTSSSRTHSLWISASREPREPIRTRSVTRPPCPCRAGGARCRAARPAARRRPRAPRPAARSQGRPPGRRRSPRRRLPPSRRRHRRRPD